MNLAAPTLAIRSREMPANWAEGGKILLYHDLSTRSHRVSDPLVVTPEAFGAQCSYLADHYEVITVADLAESISLGRSAGTTAAITIDDGYRSTMDVAWPIVDRLGIPMTVFVDTARIGRPGCLSQSDIAGLHRSGVEIGSHTATHRNLVRLGREEIAWELAHSMHCIYAITGKQSIGISYPYGKFNALVLSSTRRHGYLYGCSAAHGVNNCEGDVFCMKRIEITAFDSMARFSAKLEGFYSDAYGRLNFISRVIGDLLPV